MQTINVLVILGIIIPAVVGFIIVDRFTPYLASFMKKKGITGVDVHKLDKPSLPEMGGISIILGLTISIIILILFLPFYALEFLAFILVVLVAAVIGYLDGLRPWKAKTKIVVVALACLPIIIIGAYETTPLAPFIGQLRLTILYPIAFVPIFITLTANSTNMIDIFNGSMAGTSAIAASFLFCTAIIFGKFEAAIMYAPLIACLVAYYRYNRYPAKVFGGDVGSLAVGAAFGAIGIISGLEVVTLIALLPFMINGSLNLSSVGRLFEHREIKDRPIVLLDDGKIAANTSKNAPVTLSRLILTYGALKEYEIVRSFIALTLLAGALAILTAAFMVVWT
ncbi:MAG: hypothetical protein ABIH76_07795 [Candidatus Bathyarchaeota archaeon]